MRHRLPSLMLLVAMAGLLVSCTPQLRASLGLKRAGTNLANSYRDAMSHFTLPGE